MITKTNLWCLTAYNNFTGNKVVSTNNMSNVCIIFACVTVLPHKVQYTWRNYMEEWVAQIWNSSLQTAQPREPQWVHVNGSAAHHNPTRRQLGQSALSADTSRPLRPPDETQSRAWPHHQLFHTLRRLSAHTGGIVHRHIACFHLLNKTTMTLAQLFHHNWPSRWK